MINQEPDNIGTRFGDLRDLPEELLRQIPATRIDDTERDVIDTMRQIFGGIASVDEVLVGLYRKTGVVHDRKKLAGKLYRMVNASPPLLEAVTGRRGIYRLPE